MYLHEDDLLPQSLYSARAVREIDRIAIEEQGINGFELMTKAARFSFHTLIKAWPNTRQLVVLCGSGNNAGDGYIIASLAKKRALSVHVLFAASPDMLKGDALIAYQHCKQDNIPCTAFQQEHLEQLCDDTHTVIVDALLGTGLNSTIEGIYAEIIHACNSQRCPVIAIDIPSGLSANTGQALGYAIKADITSTFIGLKIGLFTGAGRHYSGNIAFSALDLPKNILDQVTPLAEKLALPSLLDQLAPRQKDAHKGNYGHAVVIGGDLGYGGAIILAAKATARVGAGLTTVITQEAHRVPLLNALPEVMVSCSQTMSDIEHTIHKANVVIIGPGLGQSAWSEKVLLAALQSKKNLVIDADALNLLSDKFASMFTSNTFNTGKHILTPHPGEAARLLGSDTKTLQENRLEAIQALHRKYGGDILLKGSGSLICSHDGTLSLSPYGNPGMASGGMGDVLSGLIGGLLAQGLDKSIALKLAVCLHAKAADIASQECGERGLLASDLIPIVRTLLK